MAQSFKAAHLTLFLFAAIALGERGSVSASDLMARQSPSNILGTFCADPLTDSSNPYSGGVCIDVTVGTAGLCIDITPALNPASNGVTSFSPDNNAICQMFTKSNCTGDVWASGIVLPAFQSLSFDGIVPDNAILSVQCTQ